MFLKTRLLYSWLHEKMLGRGLCGAGREVEYGAKIKLPPKRNNTKATMVNILTAGVH
jgi:hypothetical protein